MPKRLADCFDTPVNSPLTELAPLLAPTRPSPARLALPSGDPMTPARPPRPPRTLCDLFRARNVRNVHMESVGGRTIETPEAEAVDRPGDLARRQSLAATGRRRRRGGAVPRRHQPSCPIGIIGAPAGMPLKPENPLSARHNFLRITTTATINRKLCFSSHIRAVVDSRWCLA